MGLFRMFAWSCLARTPELATSFQCPHVSAAAHSLRRWHALRTSFACRRLTLLTDTKVLNRQWYKKLSSTNAVEVTELRCRDYSIEYQ
jgi:hypothetical protein